MTHFKDFTNEDAGTCLTNMTSKSKLDARKQIENDKEN